ncbi:PCD16 protein, partial [Centropus unirufus]|nr:PCD16 protein [Centropus unirufus]
LRENLPAGTLVATVRAVDGDGGVFGKLSYAVVAQPAGRGGLGQAVVRGAWQIFTLNSSSGELRSRLPLDYERAQTFHLVVTATDGGNATATATVRVLLSGEDEYEPVFLRPTWSFRVPEGARRGQSIGQVVATDEDRGVDGVVLYSLAKPSPYFAVNRTTGAIWLLLDGGRGAGTSREMTLEVEAGSPLATSRRATARVTIDVSHTALGLPPD